LHTRTSKLPSSGRREEDRGPTSASAVKTGACEKCGESEMLTV
jgi:hypothetical protein